ncbi:MAG: fructosamine kinase family protein [Pseudomonadota bacterium]
MWQSIESTISQALGENFTVRDTSVVAGGCINQGFRLRGGRRSIFLKTNQPQYQDMFTAEQQGLDEIRASDTIRTPDVIASGADDQKSWIALEYLQLESVCSLSAQEKLGESMAALHRCRANEFGWHRDNYIGTTMQINNWTESWTAFLSQHRIAHQLTMAQGAGLPRSTIDRINRLLENLAVFYRSYTPAPSLLHGDLWSGNCAMTLEGVPVIFDPAVYFGDRECDIAMTELFGGFNTVFYDAYRAAWPLDEGYRVRRNLHQLYHILNHFNLFGPGYAHQARTLSERLLSELG